MKNYQQDTLLKSRPCGCFFVRCGAGSSGAVRWIWETGQAVLVCLAGSFSSAARLRAVIGFLLFSWYLARTVTAQTEEDEPAAKPSHVDCYGDLLPDGAVLRLGSVRFRRDPHDPNCVSYSREGRILASTSGRDIVLWDAATGKVIETIRPGASRIDEIAFSPVTDVLAIKYLGGSTSVWRRALGKELKLAEAEGQVLPEVAKGLAFSEDGTKLASNCNRQTLVFDAAPPIAPREVHGGLISAPQHALAWLPDNKHLVHDSFDPPVRLCDAETGQLVREFRIPGVQAFARSLAVSRDGKTLAAGCIERGRAKILICIWDIDTGKLKASLPSGDAVSLHFTPNGESLVSFTESPANIELWDLRKIDLGRVPKHTIAERLGTGRNAALSPDGKRIAVSSASSAAIRQWDLETGQEIGGEFVGHTAETKSVCCSADGKMFATLSSGQVRLWDGQTGKQLRVLTAPGCRHLALDPKRGYLATAGVGGDVQVWNPQNGERVVVLRSDEQKLRAIQFTPDGSRLVAIGSVNRASWSSRPINDRIRVWDVDRGEEIHQFEFTASSTESMAIPEDGRSVVLGTAYGGMRVFSLETGEQVAEIPDHEAAVNSLARHGALVASGSRDKSIRLWDANTWKTVGVLVGHEADVDSVAFSADGKLLASTDRAGSIRLWSVDRREEVHQFQKTGSPSQSVVFSSTQDRFVTAHQNGTATVWSLKLVN